jgi:hypothetical protein
MKLAIKLLLVLLMATSSLTVNALPEVVKRDHMGLFVLGEGVLRKFGFKVYDARLWTGSKAPSFDDVFALELTYALSLDGKAIAERSVDEMRKQGGYDETSLKRWGEEMARAFPDVKKGDTLVGVSIPGKEARFYSRDKLLATITDPAFARAFFNIWLSDKTSEPRLRDKLLGLEKTAKP